MPITRDDISEFRVDRALHCMACVDEKPEGVSPKDWSRLSFGFFEKEGEPGIYFQLWCDRHDCNVTTIFVPPCDWEHDDTIPLRVKLNA